MKQKLIEQRNEIEARNAQMRQQQSGRPAPRPGNTFGKPAPAPAAAPTIEKVTDYANLHAVWIAARKHLVATGSKYIETTLGHDGRLESLDQITWEAVIWIPPIQRSFANEKARVKIEESLRAVTAKGVRVTFNCPDSPTGGDTSRLAPPAASAPNANTQRVPPEVVEAIKNQPVVKELMKRLDASVVNIEMLDSGE